MAGKSSTFENDFLKLIFNAVTIAGLARDDAGSYTTLYVSLHISDPGESGVQTTNETAYGSYTRIGVARTSGGWTVTASSVSPVANIDFPQCTASTATITHVGIGTLAAGAGKLLWSGAVTPNIAVAPGVVPRITSASTITEA